MNQGFIGWSGVPPLLQPYVRIEDQKAANTGGGTFTSGSYQTRTMNTIVTDTAAIASLASNQVTLPAGTYRALIACPAQTVDRHKARLQNITDATTTMLGKSSFSGATGNNDVTDSMIRGQFTITDRKTFEVQHRCQTTKTTTGFGVESNFGDLEVYTVAEFWKLA